MVRLVRRNPLQSAVGVLLAVGLLVTVMVGSPLLNLKGDSVAFTGCGYGYSYETGSGSQFGYGACTGSRYNPLVPARILDTRDGNGVAAPGKINAASSIDLQVTGRGGIPATGVTAVVMNVTVVDPTAPSFLTVWPTGETRPLAANLNFPFVPGEIVENLVKVKVGAGGKVSIYNHGGSTHIGADVAGYYGTVDAAGSRYNAVNPARILDTRDGTGGFSGQVGPASTIDMQVTGQGGIPVSGVTAVAFNVTAVSPTAPSFLTAFPTGVTRPLAANLNYVAGETITNRVIVQVGAGGKVSLYNHGGSTHIGADVAGYYVSPDSVVGANYTPLSPTRILDTRVGTGGFSSPIGPAGTIDVQVTGVGGVPADATAVVMNVTVVTPTAFSFLTAYPTGITRPVIADLNYRAGQTLSNLVLVKVGTGGKVSMYNHGGSTDVGADVAGYFTN